MTSQVPPNSEHLRNHYAATGMQVKKNRSPEHDPHTQNTKQGKEK